MTIKTEAVYPPVPIRDWDWQAYDDDTVDERSPYGEGPTEWEAICDLVEVLQWKGKWFVNGNGEVTSSDEKTLY